MSITVLEEIKNYFVYLAPSIVGPVVGVVLGGVIVQKYWTKKANESMLIDYLVKEISDLVDETLEYWSLDCSGTSAGSEEIRRQARWLEQKILADCHNMNSILGQYSDRYCKGVNFTSLMAEVHDACTCGQFQGLKRLPDHDRYKNVVNTTHRLRWQLFNRRA